jgi:hypothetical protein
MHASPRTVRRGGWQAHAAEAAGQCVSLMKSFNVFA